MNTYEKYTKDVQKFGRMTMILGMIAYKLLSNPWLYRFIRFNIVWKQR